MRTHKLTTLTLILHSIPIIICWGLYFCGVYYLIVHDTATVQMIIIVVTIWITIFVVISLVWGQHMTGLHKKYGPRSQIIQIEWDYRKDWLNYKVDADFSELKHAKVIIIACNNEARIKFFVKDD
jgi:hypothetical protein